MKVATVLTLCLQRIIMHHIISRADSTEKSRPTVYVNKVKAIGMPICYQCDKVLELGQMINSTRGGSKQKKYYHSSCYERLFH
jgi:hypothetical protein